MHSTDITRNQFHRFPNVTDGLDEIPAFKSFHSLPVEFLCKQINILELIRLYPVRNLRDLTRTFQKLNHVSLFRLIKDLDNRASRPLADTILRQVFCQFNDLQLVSFS